MATQIWMVDNRREEGGEERERRRGRAIQRGEVGYSLDMHKQEMNRQAGTRANSSSR